MTLTTSYQKIGTSGTVAFGGARAYLELYAKYNSQSIADNNTNWSIEARLVVTTGYIGDYTGVTLSLSGDGISSSQNLGTGDYRSRTLGSASGTTGHSSSGTKSVSASSTVTFKAWGKSISVSGSADLPTIPRYANITSFSVSKRDETSVKYNFTADATLDYAKYSTDNGSTWHDLPTSNVVSGLSANTTYNFKLQVRRADSGLWTTSGTVQQTTYNYPYCTSSPNFTLGNNLTLNFYNPLSRSIKIYIIGADGTQNGGDTITGTSLSGYSNSSWVNWWYSTIPNAKSGNYQVKVVYGNITRTRNNGNTYTINENNCKPIFTDFEYYDNDFRITPLTGDNQILVNGKSDCIFTIPVANKAEGQKSATITKYICQWGTGSSEVAYSSTEDVSQHVYDNTGGVLKVSAVDSRGLTTTVTKNITYIPYIDAIINTLETQRKDGVDAKTYLKGKFTIYSGSWNASDDVDSINRLKYVGYSVYINDAWSEYYDITSEVLNKSVITVNGNNKIYEFDFDDEIELHANGSSGGFTVGTEFQIRFLIKDGDATTIFTPYSYQALYEVHVTDGTVAMCLHKDSNGIYHIGLNGMSDDDWLISIGGVGIIRQKT